MKFVFLLTALLPWLFYILFAGDAASVPSSPESLEEVFLGEKPEKDAVPVVKKLKNVFAEGNLSREPENQNQSNLSPSVAKPVVKKDHRRPSAQNFPLAYEVSKVIFAYGQMASELPSLASLDEASISVSFSNDSFQISNLTDNKGKSYRLTLDDLHALGELALQYLKSEGFQGVVAFPDPQQIDPLSGKDLRKGQKGKLRFLVWVSSLQSVSVRNIDLSPGLESRITQSLNLAGEKYGWGGQALREESFRFWERYGSTPGISSRVILVPGDRPGQVQALLETKNKKNRNASLFLSNAGTETLGKWIWGASYVDSSLSDYADQLGLNHMRSNTGARQATSLSYRRPIIFPNLLETGLDLGVSEYDASSFAITRIDFDGSTKFADWYLRWKPLETERDHLSLSFELGIRAEDIQAANSLLPGRADAQFLSPRAAVQLVTKGKYLNSRSKVQVSGNLRNIDSSDLTLLGGINVEEQTSRIVFDHQESFKIGKWLLDQFPDTINDLWKDHILVSRARIDYGLEKVRHLPQRQFIAGGTGSVRGYPESPAAGDNGFFISSEYRIPLPKISTDSDLGSLSSSVIPFVDWAETEINQPFAHESDKSLLGAGVGLEMRFSNGLFSRLDIARPLREIKNSAAVLDGTRKEDHRVHALIRWEF